MGKRRDPFKEALGIFVEHAAAALAARQRRALHEERPQAGLCRLASRHDTGGSCSYHNKVVVCRSIRLSSGFVGGAGCFHGVLLAMYGGVPR